MELRRRYQSLYIPSDFFNAVFTWVDAFPLTRPFQFSNACNFHILHKEVDPLVKNTAVLDPPDANHTYSAKVGSYFMISVSVLVAQNHLTTRVRFVWTWHRDLLDLMFVCFFSQVMLLANPSLEEIYHKSCALAEDPQEVREAFQHPARLIKVCYTLPVLRLNT